MAGKKPLIFVYPLSESLQKLKDVLAETADENGLEIYEVDAAVEAVQLIPTVGQSLTLFSNPKKCAQILQAAKKYISKMNSKAILLSPKQIPRKTLDKFSKVGLTECIVEPVAPKTLLYKVNLIMRSIVAQKDEDEEEYGVKSLSSGEIEEADDSGKQRMEKGVLLDDEEGEDLYGRKKKKKDLEIEEIEREKKKNNYEEEAIETNWEGSVEKQGLDLDEEDEEKKKDYSEEEIETYYKGETAGAELNLGDDEEKEKTSYTTEEADDYSKAESSEEMELNLEDEDKEREEENPDEIDGYMRGKIGEAGAELDLEDEETSLEKEEEDTEQYLKGKINQELMPVEEELEGVIQEEVPEEEEDDLEEKDSTVLDLHEDDEPDDIEKEDYDTEEAEDYSEEKVDLELEDAEDHRKKREDLLEEEEEKDREEEEVDQIEKYYKGKIGEENTELDLEDAEDYTEKQDYDTEEAEDYKEDNESLDLHEDDEDKDKDADNVTELEFDDDMYDREKPEDEELEDYSKQKNTDLDLEDEDSNKDYERDDEGLEGEDSDRDRKSDKDLDLEDDNERNRTGSNQEEGGEFGRRETSPDLDLEDGGFQKKAKMVEKNIETHYSSKKSIKHQEYDWDNLNNRFKKQEEEIEKEKQKEDTLTYEGKDDLGEQTIDYGKLWDDFGGITIDREASKKKITGPKYVAGEKVDDPKTASFYGEDGEEEGQDFEGAPGSEEEGEIPPIYEPESNGLEIAVKILNFYQEKETKPEDVYKYIANIIWEEEAGKTSFLVMDKKKNVYEDAFISHIEFESDTPEVERKTQWVEHKLKNQGRWQMTTLPTWSDETFQAKEIEFFYPFYEGVSDLGMAVVEFSGGITQDKIKKIEIILETARGLFLEAFHDSGSRGTYKGADSVEKKEGFLKKTVGKLFGRFFKK